MGNLFQPGGTAGFNCLPPGPGSHTCAGTKPGSPLRHKRHAPSVLFVSFANRFWTPTSRRSARAEPGQAAIAKLQLADFSGSPAIITHCRVRAVITSSLYRPLLASDDEPNGILPGSLVSGAPNTQPDWNFQQSQQEAGSTDESTPPLDDLDSREPLVSDSSE